MLENRIDATLTVEDAQAVLDALAIIQQKLPFLLDLSCDDVKLRPSLGSESQAFAQRALEIAEENPELLPRSFDLQAMRHNWDTLQALAPLDGSVAQLHKMFDDALSLLGKEVMISALLIYRVVLATKGHDEVKADLVECFVRRCRSAEMAFVA